MWGPSPLWAELAEADAPELHENKAERSIVNKPVSRFPPWPLLQFLYLSSYIKDLTWLPLTMDCNPQSEINPPKLEVVTHCGPVLGDCSREVTKSNKKSPLWALKGWFLSFRCLQGERGTSAGPVPTPSSCSSPSAGEWASVHTDATEQTQKAGHYDSLHDRHVCGWR